ncbi:sulfotransferase [Phycicoccus sp. CSK15P-2]|uniref:sulfotransferase family protein n=1 Tax=Phycicoccus sp. CSK15P-2 TaxID=2807627 RepID=UPI0019501D27|nr:sulfotransferase [Phycicoccus sp. CSK15P-2]MBM6402709.1 sulfotransferase [Phycicoccus sp. CSK15P-2]
MAERGPAAQWAHGRARRASAVVGRLTASSRMEPDFLVVGAQRAGTTSLYRTLTRHPDVLPAGLHKGVHYFDTAYDRGPQWYRAHFPLRATAARVARRTGRRPVTGEASPYYMFHPLAPERIARDLPHAKVVVMLRDPVERAYSAYTHESARGFETESFERALELEPERLAGVEERFARDPHHVSLEHQHNAYLSRGHYAEQLERLAAHLGRDRILVVDSDELFLDAGPVLRGVGDFLGLGPWDSQTFEKRNARPRRSLEGALRERLESYFEDHDERLAAWWGRTPSWRG